MQNWRRQRVCIDLDYPSRLTLLKVFFNVHYFFRDSDIIVKETTKGYHFRIKQKNTVQQNLDVRRNLCDDQGRLRFDEVRVGKPVLHNWIDTLFESKWRDGKIVSKEKPCNVFSEAFITKVPATKW